MVVSCATQCMHDPTSTPFGTLVLDTARAIKERGARADEGETRVRLARRCAVGPILSDKRVHSELGSVQSTVKIDFDRLQVGRF